MVGPVTHGLHTLAYRMSSRILAVQDPFEIMQC